MPPKYYYNKIDVLDLLNKYGVKQKDYPELFKELELKPKGRKLHNGVSRLTSTERSRIHRQRLKEKQETQVSKKKE